MKNKTIFFLLLISVATLGAMKPTRTITKRTSTAAEQLNHFAPQKPEEHGLKRSGPFSINNGVVNYKGQTYSLAELLAQ